MNKKNIIISALAVLILAGAGTTTWIVSQNNNSDDTKTETVQVETAKLKLNNNELSYSGRDGVSALDLLLELSTAETTGTGEMAYVTSIDGVTANPNNQYWAFLINDEMASVGAGSYITSNSDTITWKLSSF